MDRFYSFRIVTYHTDLNIIQQFCNNVFKYAFALHDKDLNEDGSPRSPHYHILCTFKSNKSFEAVRRLFPPEQNTFCKAMTDKVGDFLYLTHKNAPDKFQYPDSIIQCNDFKFFEDKQSSAISNEEFYSDLSSSSMLTMKDLCIKYGRDIMKNYHAYKDFVKHAEDEAYNIQYGLAPHLICISYEDFLVDLQCAIFYFIEDLFGSDIARLKTGVFPSKFTKK